MGESPAPEAGLAVVKNVAVVVLWMAGVALLSLAAIDWVRYSGFLLTVVGI